MITTAHTLARDAALLLALLLLVALLGPGVEFAMGAGLAGGLIIANLWAWTHIVGWLLQPDNPTAAPSAVLVYGVKMSVLLGGLVLLSLHFPPVSVLAGASVLVGAVLFTAVRAMVTQPQIGEA